MDTVKVRAGMAGVGMAEVAVATCPQAGLSSESLWGKHYTDQTWVEVDCAALRHNLEQYRQVLGIKTNIMPIVKANAYGHGLVAVSRELLGSGVNILGVFNLNEALILRAEGITSDILVLGYTAPERVAEIPAQNPIALAVYDLANAKGIAAVAQETGRIIPLHLKIDSGLHRLGVEAEAALPFVQGVTQLPGVRLAGLFTHFADAETPEHEYTAYQLGRFAAAVQALKSAGYEPGLVHATASAGALCMLETRLDLVRLGIALYGLWPSPETKLLATHSPKVAKVDLRPALSWHARVVQVKQLPAGVAVGYGCTYQTKRSTRLAVISAGYADGYDRSLSGHGEILLQGRRVPVIGRVCMNMLTADITDLPPVKSGEPAVLLGRQGGQEITADELAEKIGTLNYEVVTRINWNLKRIYQNGICVAA